MLRNPVVSSRISSVGWENGTLEVQFQDGAVYQYYNVSETEYRVFINPGSLGRSLYILEKTHRYTRV